jgi:hypothetical protein
MHPLVPTLRFEAVEGAGSSQQRASRPALHPVVVAWVTSLDLV